jgi:UDP-GlcNAc3NAcA epimerase
MKTILTIIGARPQFIKASVVSRAFKEHCSDVNEIIVHTGQHYDANMSNVFFDELDIPKPFYNLGIGGGSHGQNTGRMIERLEGLMMDLLPQRVLVYGDTDSTLAGALAAVKLHIPVAHVEAGLRSFNRNMPEEINRILTDQVSDILFCPTHVAFSNLEQEGFTNKPVKFFNVGDVMHDSALFFAERSVKPEAFKFSGAFVLATLHRAENTDNIERLSSIVDGLNYVHAYIAPVVLPLHPRTRNLLIKHGLTLKVDLIDPVGYLEMIWLLQRAGMVLTDSGGLQKEAFFFGKACVTMRDQTEWVELVEHGANELVGADSTKIVKAVQRNFTRVVEDNYSLYGGGQAAQRIAELLLK